MAEGEESVKLLNGRDALGMFLPGQRLVLSMECRWSASSSLRLIT